MGDRGFEVSRGSGRYRSGDHGVTPVVGIILLLGMVFVGAAVVASSGVIMIDALETESETERALDCLDRTDHSVETLLRADKLESIPCDSTFTDDGTVTIRLLDENGAALETVTIDKLGAFEYDLDSRTVGYQSGGVFLLRDGSVTVHRAPDVGFGFGSGHSLENQSLDLGFLNMTESRPGGKFTRMRHDQQRSTAASDELAAALEKPYRDIEITVESRYHEGWAVHLREAFYADSYSNVSVADDATAGTATVTIQNAKPQQPHFEVTDVTPADWAVPYGPDEAFAVNVTVTNTGTASGSETIVLEVPEADDGTKTVSTGTLNPGESVTKKVSFGTERIPSGSPSPETLDVDAYDNYEYTVSTSDGSAQGSFYLSFPDEALYRIESFARTIDEPFVNITADVRNVGEVEAPIDTTLTLDSDSDELPDPVKTYQHTLSTGPWNESTLEYSLNKSVLPDANYTYTLELHNEGDAATVCSNYPDACTRSGTFRIEDGVVGDPGEVIVTEPTQVRVSIIGTEISNERETWSGYYDKYWDPVTASAVVGDKRYRFKPDGTVEQIPLDQPHYTPDGKTMDDYDLNTYDSQRKVYDFETNMTSGSVTIEATRWQCQNNHFSSENIVYKEADGDWHYDCPSYYYGEPTTVDTNDGVATSDSGFVMTRDSERNYVPDIPPGYPRQRSVQEVFEDGTNNITLENNHLQLGQNDFAFMMEATMDREQLIDEYEHEYDGPYDLYTDNQTELNLAAWDIVKNYRDDSSMDPNYNDVIGVVQIDGGGRYIDLDGVLEDYRIDKSGVSPTVVSNSDDYDPPGPTITSGPGVIEIS
ncbi:DUF7289 family protein [Halovivax limisalsi]|uniref:DUF7289 family protein n=1 Tax=Halovivax limisalsi TaxID=1453760 RepID=UPI001FFC5810|nr:hypothetical protein [Halovivax limisalsi]